MTGELGWVYCRGLRCDASSCSPLSPPSHAVPGEVFQTETRVDALVSQLRAVVEVAGPGEKREVYPGDPGHPEGRGPAVEPSSYKKNDFVPK